MQGFAEATDDDALVEPLAQIFQQRRVSSIHLIEKHDPVDRALRMSGRQRLLLMLEESHQPPRMLRLVETLRSADQPRQGRLVCQMADAEVEIHRVQLLGCEITK